jgi:alkylation response protein AidB-like acyl-CoA dehydrogenase
VNAVAAFLDPSHVDFWNRVRSWNRRVLRARPEPATDVDARNDARAILGLLGGEGWLNACGNDVRSVCLVREATAAESPLGDAVVAVQALGATPLMLAGTARQRDEWLPGIVAGQVMAAFAMSEPSAGSDVAAMETTAERDGAFWTITGEKHLISNAGIADVYFIFAKTTPDRGSRGITLFVVPRESRGLEFVGAQTMSAAHPLGRLRLVNCRVPADAVVGEIDRGFKVGMMTLDRVRPTVGAAACGMATRALEEAVAHACGRRQFGQTLADMALVREKIGRMATELDAARLLVYRAAWEHDTQPARHAAAAAMAKAFATEMAQRVVDESIQIIGGGAVLLGHPVERLYRSVRALRIYEGATDIQRLIVAGAVIESSMSAASSSPARDA